MQWCEDRQNGVLLRLVIQPRASRTETVGLHGTPPRLKIRVAAPPVDGEANEALIAFLAKRLGIAKSCVQIERGTGSKMKDVLCKGVSAQTLCEKFFP